MSQPGETDHFSLEDHVRALQKHSFEGAVDIVVTHSNKASSEILEKYKKMGSEPIKVVEKNILLIFYIEIYYLSKII